MSNWSNLYKKCQGVNRQIYSCWSKSSCVGRCDEEDLRSDHKCQCDEGCEGRGDCCPDLPKICYKGKIYYVILNLLSLIGNRRIWKCKKEKKYIKIGHRGSIFKQHFHPRLFANSVKRSPTAFLNRINCRTNYIFISKWFSSNR